MRLAGFMLSALFLAASAQAEFPPPPPPHDASQARCAIERFIDAVNRHDLSEISTTRVFANEVGQVSEDNAPEFFTSFDVGTVLTKRDPLTIRNVAVLELNEVFPIYLATIERKYAKERYWAVWLFQFKTNDIVVARRADELWPLLERGSFAFTSCGSANS